MDFQIKEARENAGFSQKELAELIGVAPSTLNGYESGKHDPKSDLLVKIAAACHVTTDYLLCHASQKQKTAPWPEGQDARLDEIIGIYHDVNEEGKDQMLLQAQQIGNMERFAPSSKESESA